MVSDELHERLLENMTRALGTQALPLFPNIAERYMQLQRRGARDTSVRPKETLMSAIAHAVIPARLIGIEVQAPEGFVESMVSDLNEENGRLGASIANVCQRLGNQALPALPQLEAWAKTANRFDQRDAMAPIASIRKAAGLAVPAAPR